MHAVAENIKINKNIEVNKNKFNTVYKKVTLTANVC